MFKKKIKISKLNLSNRSTKSNLELIKKTNKINSNSIMKIINKNLFNNISSKNNKSQINSNQ